MNENEKLSKLYSQLYADFGIDHQAFSSALEEFVRLIEAYNEVQPGIAQLAKDTVKVMEFIKSADFDYDQYNKIIREYYEIFSAGTDYPISAGEPITSDGGISETVIQDSISAAESALPQVEEPLRENYTLSVDAVKGRDPGWWDNERIRAWIGILISLYMLVLQLMPDPQLTEIIEQNNTIIEIQQEQLAEAKESNEEQKKLIQKLADSICALTEELEESREASDGLGDGGEGIDNTVDGDTHPDAADCQDDDTELQN